MHESVIENARHVLSLQPQAVVDLVATAGPVGHDKVRPARARSAGNSDSSAMAKEVSIVSAP